MQSNMSRGKVLFLTTLLLLLWGCAGSEVPPTTDGPVSLFLERIQSKHRAEATQVEVAEPGPTREEIHLRMRPGWEQKPLTEREDDAIILTRTWVRILTQPKGNVTTALAYWLPIEADVHTGEGHRPVPGFRRKTSGMDRVSPGPGHLAQLDPRILRATHEKDSHNYHRFTLTE